MAFSWISIRDFAPEAPAGATVAKGTYKGTNILVNNLKDTVTGKRAGDFLDSLPSKPKLMIITGHSLGGTLTPVYFAYLNILSNQGTSQTASSPSNLFKDLNTSTFAVEIGKIK